jgi:hypothetical protein
VPAEAGHADALDASAWPALRAPGIPEGVVGTVLEDARREAAVMRDSILRAREPRSIRATVSRAKFRRKNDWRQAQVTLMSRGKAN